MWQSIDGVIERGHQVASGNAIASPYPEGTIALQAPFFRALGLDLSSYFQGTLNVSIRPKTFQLVQPEFTFRQVEWTDRHPPEDFSFSRCCISFEDSNYDSLIYYPHPETKKSHFQDSSIVEIIAPPIPAIHYDSRIVLEYNPSEVVIRDPDQLVD